MAEQGKKKLSLTTKIMIGTALGLALGSVFGERISDIRVIGDIFIRLIQMVVPVLILGSVIEAIGKIDRKQVGRIGIKTIGFFMMTTSVAAISSVVVNFFIINPGRGLDFPELANYAVEIPETQTITDVILGFFGNNIINSMAQGTIVQIIVFAILFGLSLGEYTSRTGDQGVLNAVNKFNQLIMGFVKMVMNLAPVAVFSLMAWVAADVGLDVIVPLLMYLGGLAAVLLTYYLVFYTAVGTYIGVSPIKLFQKTSKALIIASTTTSSAMALPTAMEDTREKLGVSRKIGDIVNPLGINLNADGQVMFTTAASIMLLNVMGVDIQLGQLINIVVICTLATFGVLAVPGGALVVLAGLLPQFGIPSEAIAIIAGVDWFRGMITTPANISGDMLAAVTIAKSEGQFYKEVFDGELTTAEAEEKYAATGGKVVASA